MIDVSEFPEPLTPAAEKTQPVLVESDAFRRLLTEIRRYLRGETTGRSFLVSGHRGAGKTTAIRFAVHRAQQEALQARREPAAGARTVMRWPMLVPLHGPDLLGGMAHERLAPVANGTATPKRDPASSNGTAGPAKDKDKDEAASAGTTAPATGEAGTNGAKSQPGGLKEDARTTESEKKSVETASAALRFVARSLHRALMDELANGFKRWAESAPATGRGAEFARADGAFELAAHVAYEMDHAADFASLREYWRRAGALERGMLWNGRGDQEGVAAAASGGAQGARELLAVASAIEAFRVVAGKTIQTDKSDQSANADRTVTSDTKLSGKDLFGAVAGLVTGGAVGIAAGAGQGASVPIAALLGLGSALLTAVTVSRTTTRSRKSGRATAQEFIWDTSIASLDRMLPVLVDRILDAGIAPIFVVDELDKVDGLKDAMAGLVNQLKHFVTEKAFFCFVTDRSYFEQVTLTNQTGSYNREFTFFSERLFIQHVPDDLRAYLKQILTARSKDDEIDRDLLLYLLPFESRMNAIALRWAMRRASEEDLRSLLGNQLRAFMQLAIEQVLGEARVKDRMRLDPLFPRLAVDTLYYPAVRWRQGHRELSLAGLKAFVEERMNGDETDAGKATATDASGSSRPQLEVPAPDLDFLSWMLGLLVEKLVDPSSAAVATPPRWLPEKFTTPLLKTGASGGTWLWLYDEYGQQIADVAAPTSPPVSVDTPPPPPAGGPTETVRPTAERSGISEPSNVPEAVAEIAAPTATNAPLPPAPSARALEPSAAVPSAPTAPVSATPVDAELARSTAGQIEALDRMLAELSRDISLESLAAVSILAPTPKWSSVARSSAALLAAKARVSDLRQEIEIVTSYGSMLTARASLLRDSLMLAAFVVGARHQGEPMTHGLALVSGLLGCHTIDAAICGADARRLVSELVPRLDPAARLVIDKNLEGPAAEFGAWLPGIAAAFTRYALQLPPVELTSSAEESTRQRWTTFLSSNAYGSNSAYDVSLGDLYRMILNHPCLVAAVDEMTIGALCALAPPNDQATPLLRAVLSFLGAGRTLVRQHRTGERILLFGPPFSNARPSEVHAVLPVLVGADVTTATFQIEQLGKALGGENWLTRYAPTVILIDVSYGKAEEFGRALSQYVRYNARWAVDAPVGFIALKPAPEIAWSPSEEYVTAVESLDEALGARREEVFNKSAAAWARIHR